MHGSLEDGNAVEEANVAPDETDEDGIIVVTLTVT